jgi:hypothetical protein
MLLFKCTLTHNELTALQNYLPHDEFCIVNKPGEVMYYGVMEEELHGKFMDILSGETLELLEYLDEKDMKELLRSASFDVVGNGSLLKEFKT